MSEKLAALLQHCTVKITGPDHHYWGTGFLVSPGLILTCAQADSRLNLSDYALIHWPQQETFAEAKLIQKAPQLDLALLQFIPPSTDELPCVYLDESVQSGNELYLFGYLEKAFPMGCTVIAKCKGLTDDEPSLIKFEPAQENPEMSGAALLNQNTGKVCGIVKSVSDRTLNPSGSAIPVSVILEHFPKLRELQQRFHQDDPRWTNLLHSSQSSNRNVTVQADANAPIITGDHNTVTDSNVTQQGKYNINAQNMSQVHIGDVIYFAQSQTNEIVESDIEIYFEPYLRSLIAQYAKLQQSYTVTGALGQAQGETKNDSFSFFSGLMVQTAKEPTQGNAFETKASSEKDGTTEQLPVLEGIHKYADEHVMLIGLPGSGKSTALIRLLLDVATQTLAQGEGLIPVLVELRYWHVSIIERIRASLKKHGTSPDLNDRQLINLLHQGRFLLLIDGLNELPSEVAQRDVARFERDFSKIPMVFTTRDLSLGGKLWIEKKLKMQPLNTDQMRQFVHNYLGSDLGEQLLSQVTNRLQELGKTPLLLAMLCSIFRADSQLPTNVGEIFRQFTRFYEHNIKGDVPDPYEYRDDWDKLLQHLAFTMMQGVSVHNRLKSLSITISRHQAEKALTVFFRDRKPYPLKEAECCLKELLKYHLIQISGNQIEIEFRHQLIQEYYAAEYLIRLLPDLNDNDLKQDYLNHLKWTESIALMIGLIGEEQAVRVVKLAFDVDLGLGLRLTETLKFCVSESAFGTVDEFIFGEISESVVIGEHKAVQIDLLRRTYSRLAIPKLVDFLNDPDPAIAVKAAIGLGHLGYKEAVPYLLNMLSNLSIWIPCDDGYQTLCDRTLHLEVRIIEAIGMLSPEDAIPHLQKLADDQQSLVFKFSEPNLTNLLVKHDGAAYISKYLEVLESSQNPNELIQASDFLARRNNTDAIETLIRRLKEDLHIEVVKCLIQSLGHFDSQRGSRAIAELLASDDSTIRQAASEVLMKYNRTEVTPVLIEQLESREHEGWVQWCAAIVLGKFRNEKAIPVLLARIASSENNRIRATAIEILGLMMKNNLESYLKPLLKDLDYRVRRSSAIALSSLRCEESIPELLSALRHYRSADEGSTADLVPFRSKWTGESVYLVPKCLGSDDAADSWLWEKRDFKVRERIVESLSVFECPEIIDGLIAAMRSPDGKAAAVLLGERGYLEAVPTLIELLASGVQLFCSYNKIIDSLVTLANQYGSRLIEALIFVLENIDSYETEDFYFPNRIAIVLAKSDHPDMTRYIPRLSALMQTGIGEQAYWVVSSIQSREQFYNRELEDDRLAASTKEATG
jgi:HEAT repeat protein